MSPAVYLTRQRSKSRPRQDALDREIARIRLQEEARSRGLRDAASDTQRCELPPPGMKADLTDAWTAGYRQGWQNKGATHE